MSLVLLSLQSGSSPEQSFFTGLGFIFGFVEGIGDAVSGNALYWMLAVGAVIGLLSGVGELTKQRVQERAFSKMQAEISETRALLDAERRKATQQRHSNEPAREGEVKLAEQHSQGVGEINGSRYIVRLDGVAFLETSSGWKRFRDFAALEEYALGDESPI